MRTFKRSVKPLNDAKNAALVALVDAFNKEKADWVRRLRGYKGFGLLGDLRKQVRDPAVKAKYVSPHGLSARMWKTALDEAVGMVDRYWQAHFVNVRRVLSASKLTPSQKFYCYCVLKRYRQLDGLLHGDLPPQPTRALVKEAAAGPNPVPLTKQEQIVAAHHLRWAIRAKLPRFVTVRKARSVVIDQNCYKVFMHNGVQYADIVTLQKGKRIALPLEGYCATETAKPRTHRAMKNTAHFGTIKIVLGNVIMLHVACDVDRAARAARRQCTDDVLALDAGYTDVFADQHGKFYGPDLGETLMAATDTLHDKGIARNRLHALEKRYRNEGKTRKANAMVRFNLGKVKKDALTQRQHATVDCIINRALNDVLDQKPKTVICENLSHTFRFELGKKTNRRLSAWTKGQIAERTDFKAHVRGSHVERVNGAYSSQACSVCGWVDSSNRNGHAFHCRYCGQANHADTNAASNLVRRAQDKEITLYTPHLRVKHILQSRYDEEQKRRLETVVLLKTTGTVQARL